MDVGEKKENKNKLIFRLMVSYEGHGLNKHVPCKSSYRVLRTFKHALKQLSQTPEKLIRWVWQRSQQTHTQTCWRDSRLGLLPTYALYIQKYIQIQDKNRVIIIKGVRDPN